jgi:cytoskeleton protein RodZ
MNQPLERSVGVMPDPDRSTGPGAQLAAARAARGMDIDAVVAVLRYSRRQIEALEADDHASLPPPAVVRGMIRAYARHVGLDAAPLLEHLPSSAGAPALVGEFMEVPFQGQGGARHGLVWWSLGLIVLALAVTLGADRLFRRGSQAPVQAESAETSAPAAGPDEAARAPGNDAGAPSVAPVDAAPALLQSAAGSSTPTATPGIAAGGSASEPPAIAPAVTGRPVAPGSDSKPLVLETLDVDFRGRAWIEVRDARDELLATGAFEAGTRKRLQGQPPIRVVIGSASAVQVLWRGSAVDLAPYASGNVARVTLQ